MIPLLPLVLLDGATTNTVSFANGKPAGHAIVFLQGGGRPKPLDDAVIDQRDHRFLPHVCVVTVGTHIRFPNNETVCHNVFTACHASRFDLGTCPRGKSKFQTFDRAGVDPYQVSRFMQDASLATIQALAAVEAKDPYTKGHSLRVAEMAEAFCAMIRGSVSIAIAA